MLCVWKLKYSPTLSSFIHWQLLSAARLSQFPLPALPCGASLEVGSGNFLQLRKQQKTAEEEEFLEGKDQLLCWAADLAGARGLCLAIPAA